MTHEVRWFADNRFEKVIACLPASFREGKLPFVFFLVSMVIAVLLLNVAMGPYQSASPMFLSMAALLTLLMVLVHFGMPLSWGVHMGTLAGVVLLCLTVWNAGGIFSPAFAWLLILPLTPFYATGRRAGFFWMGMVWLVQLGMAWCHHLGWVPPFSLGIAHATTSWVTFSVITGMLIALPLIYDRLHARAVAQSTRYQKELEDKRQELVTALHMREHFIATVSHELRTPMNAILGFNTLLLSRVKHSAQALKVLNHTRQSADHLMTVINDILDYSQLQTGQLVVQPETFELRKIVGYAFDLFGPRVKSMALDVRMVLDEALPVWVHTDRHRLMQVLVNLLGNALKFTHQGEVVLRVQWLNPGVLFSVSDTGIGIAPERQAQIFQQFSQADSDIQARYGGNGLGLAISQKLAHLLGGEMGFESQLGQGSRFWLRLPLTAVPAPEQAPAASQIEVQTRETPWRFLVADDHPINRLLAKQVLQNAWPRCEVLEAVNGQDALDCLRNNTIDLVLMDMVMPVMDGIVATRAVREVFAPPVQNVPILGLTANVSSVDLDVFQQSGLSALMLKPFEPAVLCSKVEQLLLAR